MSFIKLIVAQDLIMLNNGDSINCMITLVDNKFIYFAYKDDNGNLMNVILPKTRIINFQREYYGKIQPASDHEIHYQKVLQNDTAFWQNHRITNIKGMLGYAIYFWTVTIGLESEIARNSSIEIVLNGSFALYNSSSFAMPGYRHYFQNDFNRRISGFFISGYGLYWRKVFFRDWKAPPNKYITKYCGLGFATGNKFLLNKRHTLIFDLGFGIAIVDNIETSVRLFMPTWEPRFIFNLGYRF